MILADGQGGERHLLHVSYRQAPDSSFLLCRLFPEQPPLTLVFVTGPEHDRVSVRRSAVVMCSSSWGDNPGLTESATFMVEQGEDPVLWDALFPPRSDGSRWFALRAAAVNAHGAWDSRFGEDYRLVLRPR